MPTTNATLTPGDWFTPEQLQKELDFALARARAIQREQHLLITSRARGAARRFGQLERELEGPNGAWARVDALRAAIAAAK